MDVRLPVAQFLTSSLCPNPPLFTSLWLWPKADLGKPVTCAFIEFQELLRALVHALCLLPRHALLSKGLRESTP